MNEQTSPRFYFALPRLLAKIRGGDGTRAEKNAVEASISSFAIYAISYLYFAAFIPAELAGWLRVFIFIALAFLVVVFWLLVLQVNSLILTLARSMGLFRSLPQRHGQGVLIATAVTTMAAALARRDSIVSELGVIWLIATAMNLVAAMILAFSNGPSARQ